MPAESGPTDSGAAGNDAMTNCWSAPLNRSKATVITVPVDFRNRTAARSPPSNVASVWNRPVESVQRRASAAWGETSWTT